MPLILAALLVLGIGLAPSSIRKQTRRVDLIELNHFLDHEGREVFRQVIFYDWSPATKNFHIRQWRLIRREDELPRQISTPRGYQCQWFDKDGPRTVQAADMRETWSQTDPEQTNRKLLSEDHRRPLFD